MEVPLAERTLIPTVGIDEQTLLDSMESYRDGDVRWEDGRVFSLIYDAGPEHRALLTKAHNLFFSANGLNPMAFRSLKRMEAEVVQMTAGMLHGAPETVGTMTSGGTESLLLAVKTYRDLARKSRPWIRRPEMVVPRTIHVAFDKAAHYFGVKMRRAKVDEDGRVNVESMRKLVNRNTVLLAASAPQYPHGVIDPIEALGELAQTKKVPLHIDACFGGFILPWLERLGRPVTPWDFRVPGVTSISADIHKYGYAPKGASVIVYRSMDQLRHQFFVATDWPGGIYASPSIPGTRPGGCISAAWASMMALGEEGYIALAKKTIAAADQLKAGIHEIDGLRVVGRPEATIVTYASATPEVDIYAVADQLQGRGWSIDRQQEPPSIHCSLHAGHSTVIDGYLVDVAEAVAAVRSNPDLARSGDAAMYGMMAKVPLRGLVKHSVLKIMEGMYGPDGEIPDLSEFGDDGDVVTGLINKYGDRAMTGLEHLSSVRERIRRKLRSES
jgi:glutamate/tyrosine decarboxylase-like PLP-dependent enzyme